MQFINIDNFKLFWQKIRYPKFLMLIFTFVVAYLLIAGQELSFIRDYFIGLGYIGIFIAGIMYAYSFTAGPATGIFLVVAKHQDINILLAGIIAGAGALVADMLIFKFIRESFSDEIEQLSNEPLTKYIHSKMPDVFKKYLVPVIGCIIIASPLPDELGVTMVAVSTLPTKIFMAMSFLLNTLGIIVVFYLGSIII